MTFAVSRWRPTAFGPAFALLAALVLLAPRTHADDSAAAARAFEQGAKLFAEREYRQAAQLFSRAYKLSPHGDSAYNAALSWERAGERGLAAESYAEAVGRDLRAEARKDAEARLLELKRALVLIIVAEPEGARASIGDRAREIPAEFFVEPGRRLVTVFGDGHPPRSRQLDVRAGTEHIIEVPPEDKKEKAAAAPPPTSRRLPPEPNKPSKLWPALGWTGVAIGSVLAGATTYLGVQAKDARNEFNDSLRLDPNERQDVLDQQARTRAVGIAAAIVGTFGVTILVVHSAKSRPEVALRLGPTGAAFRSRF